MDIRYTNYNKCLTNVANSILKYYDLKTYHSTLKELDDILEEKRYKNIILMLYDGMGSNILKRNLSSNSFLNKNKLMNIDAVFPATTTASTTSVLSGKNPNEHGLLGLDLYFKEFDKTISIFPNTIKDTNLLFSEQNVSEIKYQYTNIIKKVATKVNSVGLFPFKETKYIDIDEGAMDVRLTNKENTDGTNGAPALYANIPILNIKDEARKNAKVEETKTETNSEKETAKQEEVKQEETQNVEKAEETKISEETES